MIKRLFFLLGVLALTSSPVLAQNTPAAPPYDLCAAGFITTTNPYTCKATQGYLMGLENVSSAVQVAVITCTDNGVVVHVFAPMGNTQFIWMAPPGIPFHTNLVCTAGSAPNQSGIAVYVR